MRALFGCLFLIQCINFSYQGRLNVTVYYETFCGDSINFIKNQLYPAYAKIGTYLTLDYVPYGFAKTEQINGSWYFTCQHGPRECQGNKIQACSLNIAPSPQSLIKFLYCGESSADPSSFVTAKKCAYNAGLCWKCIQGCFNSEKGDEMMVEMGKRTAALGKQLTFIPTVVFNGVYNQSLQDSAMRNFLETACTLFAKKPKECNA